MMLMKISILCLGSSLISFMKLNKHLLGMLISLEATMLSLLVFLFSFILNYNSGLYWFLVLLTFVACEAALGLSLLVSVLRVRGNDLTKSVCSMNFYV